MPLITPHPQHPNIEEYHKGELLNTSEDFDYFVQDFLHISIEESPFFQITKILAIDLTPLANMMIEPLVGDAYEYQLYQCASYDEMDELKKEQQESLILAYQNITTIENCVTIFMNKLNSTSLVELVQQINFHPENKERYTIFIQHQLLNDLENILRAVDKAKMLGINKLTFYSSSS